LIRAAKLGKIISSSVCQNNGQWVQQTKPALSRWNCKPNGKTMELFETISLIFVFIDSLSQKFFEAIVD